MNNNSSAPRPPPPAGVVATAANSPSNFQQAWYHINRLNSITVIFHIEISCCFERLAHWLVGNEQRFQGTVDFAHALLLLAEASTVLHYCCDHLEVNWYAAGFSIIEQGERASSLSLILSGRADIIREEADGIPNVLARLEPGAFFGSEELVYTCCCLGASHFDYCRTLLN